MRKIEIPECCPSCASNLEVINDQLYCRNDYCPAKTSKSLEHFTRTLKIKGFGPKTLERLEITSIAELYDSLDEEDRYVELFGQKTAEKLIRELFNSKEASLEDILPALSIPLVGPSASVKICQEVSHISEILEDTCAQAGLGPKVTSNLISYIKSKDWELLPFTFRTGTKKKASKGIVCISGKLTSFKTKKEASEFIEELGFSVSSSVSKTVNYLINESGTNSAKTQKAQSLGIPILTNVSQLKEL